MKTHKLRQLLDPRAHPTNDDGEGRPHPQKARAVTLLRRGDQGSTSHECGE